MAGRMGKLCKTESPPQAIRGRVLFLAHLELVPTLAAVGKIVFKKECCL